MVQLGLSLCIFTTILGIGAAGRLLSDTETEIEGTSTPSVNITNPTNTSDRDGRDSVTFSQSTEITEDYYDETEEDRMLSFPIPADRKKIVKMTVNEINQIFNKGGFLRNKNRRLTRTDKMKARECRRKKKLYFRKTKKCHDPLVQGPCKDSTKWIVAIRGRLDGVCRQPACLDDAAPIFYKGTCVPIDNDDCPQHSRLYMNRRGEGYCGCEEGHSQYQGSSCHRDYFPGPCTNSTVLVAGQCLADPCQPGQLLWRDGECHPASPSVSDCEGELVLDTDSHSLTCQPRHDLGRAVLPGSVRRCRRGTVWSRWRGKCVTLFG